MTGKWIGSFIPQHVSNRVLLGGYRMLSLFGAPGFIREKHFRKNCIWLEGPESPLKNTANGFIENQAEWGRIRFGVGRRCSMAYAGCEIIAAYNAKMALDGPGSGMCMAELIRVFEARGAALWGAFGTTPTAIAAYFRKNGFSVETAYGEDVFAAEEIGCKYAVMTATAYNDKNDIAAQIHTVCITRNQDGSYVLHNAYRRDEKGRYRESAPYESLQEAAACISGGKSKLIYLIGIGRKDRGEPH